MSLAIPGSGLILGILKETILFFSAVSFLVYGIGCFTSKYLNGEFVRYGFSSQRMLIGVLQLCGSLSLVAGLWVPLLGRFAAAGLAVMMLAAIGVRIKIRDSFVQTTPAILYFFLNAYLALFG